MWLHILGSNLILIYSWHILKQDVIFQELGAHILVKWTKTLQEKSAHHFVQVPTLHNKVSCPVLAIQQLLASRKLVPSDILFPHNPPTLPSSY